MQPLVNCPEWDSGQQGGHKQMYVDISEPFCHKFMIFNEWDNFIIISSGGRGKVEKERENLASIFEVSACEFPDYKWVTNHMAII